MLNYSVSINLTFHHKKHRLLVFLRDDLSGAIYCDRLVRAGPSHTARHTAAGRGVTLFRFLYWFVYRLNQPYRQAYHHRTCLSIVHTTPLSNHVPRRRHHVVTYPLLSSNKLDDLPFISRRWRIYPQRQRR